MREEIVAILETALVDTDYWNASQSDIRITLDELGGQPERLDPYELHLLYMLSKFRAAVLACSVIGQYYSLSERQIEAARDLYINRYRARVLTDQGDEVAKS